MKLQAIEQTEFASAAKEGLYLYCVAPSGQRASLGDIGLEGKRVYTIPYHNISAVVHASPSPSYLPPDPEQMKSWVLTHHRVVLIAWEIWGDILPASFNTIIQSRAPEDATCLTEAWLKAEYHSLTEKMARLSGKGEYRIRVFWRPPAAGKPDPHGPEIEELERDAKTKARSLAYNYGQRLAELMVKEIDDELSPCLVDRLVEQTGVPPDQQPVLDIGCLVPKEKHEVFVERMEKLNQKRKDFFLRFSGPWPPYSFA